MIEMFFVVLGKNQCFGNYWRMDALSLVLKFFLDLHKKYVSVFEEVL